MANSATQARIITVLMEPKGIRRTGLEIANLTGMHKTTVFKALREGIKGVRKDYHSKRGSNTRPADLYYWDEGDFKEAIDTAQKAKQQTPMVELLNEKDNVIPMPIKNNGTALKVTDLSGIPKQAMPHLINSLNTISPDAIHAFRRIRNRLSDMDDSWSPENVRLQLIITCGVVMQMCIDMGKQSDEPIAPQANQKDSDNS